MNAISVAKMRELERIAIEEYNTPALLLMENAATGFTAAVQASFGSVCNRRVHVFCGSGNNGGDGFAIARMMKNLGANVSITLLCNPTHLTGDAKTNFTIVQKMEIPFVAYDSCTNADLIVDAIFGTGFRGETKGDVLAAIDAINESNAFVVSVDVPSGVSAESGAAASHAVFCDLCVTFCAIKKGLLFYPAKSHYQMLMVTGISVPGTVINSLATEYDIIDRSKIALLPKRCQNTHKGSFGKATAFVGSKGMSGAAYLASSAILKTGAGMATAAIPEEILTSLASQLRAVMTLPLSSQNVQNVLSDYVKGQDVVLAGCGIGTGDFATDTLLHLIKTANKPMVIDADGLNILSKNLAVLEQPHAPMILTPHVVEFSRLSGFAPAQIKENPVLYAGDFAKRYQVTVVLKDAVTVVCSPDGSCAVSAGSNSGLATAGSGDVLAGIITGLAAQGATAYNACVCGVYLHLAAGQLAREALSEYGFTSEDLLTYLPQVFIKAPDISEHIKEM